MVVTQPSAQRIAVLAYLTRTIFIILYCLPPKSTLRSLRRWNFYLNKLPLLRNGRRNFRTVKKMDRNRRTASCLASVLLL
uniref:Secreted protein n=1 Tax=Ditylenchus dipsaci TaxID=166011 RepID=A0A915E3F5_9BILA